MRTILRVTALAVLVSPAALAKLPTIKITLAGNGLAQPVEVTDESIVKRFNPYSGGFLHRSASSVLEPPKCSTSSYEVTFYLEGQVASGLERRQYVAYYCRDTATQQGYIYLPGKGEKGYASNGLHHLAAGAGWFLAPRVTGVGQTDRAACEQIETQRMIANPST